MNKIGKGKQAFEAYYRQWLHSDRELTDLLDGLTNKFLPVVAYNKLHEEAIKKIWASHGLSFQKTELYPYAVYWPEEVSFGQKLPGYAENLLYPLSISSLLPVLSLDIQPADTILDACAAPGGKTLAIANLLDSGSLIANDISPNRVARLRQVISDFNLVNTRVVQGDAKQLKTRFPEMFDAILLDAPCSGEQHVYNSQPHLGEWSPRRIKELQARQSALLESLVPCLKPLGRLVYSTCAITPEENEVVVEKFLEIHPEFQLEKPILPFGDPGMSEYRHAASLVRVWPHHHCQDPIFVAKMIKNV